MSPSRRFARAVAIIVWFAAAFAFGTALWQTFGTK